MSAEMRDFVFGAVFNLAVAIVLVRFIYYRYTPNRSYVFTFLAFNPTIYFVMGLLTSFELSVGVGFGLFAIFSVIRYRTEEMIRDMTYMFIIIALPVMNSILGDGGEFAKVLIANGTILGLLYVIEREWGFTFEVSKKVVYEKIDLIRPDRADNLIADLRARTGLHVTRAEVGRIDFLRDVADVVIYYDHADTPEKRRVHGLSAEFHPLVRQVE